MTQVAELPVRASRRDFVAEAAALAPAFASRAAAHDAADGFVAENFAEIRAAGLLEAGVPAELGGGGAEPRELAAMLRTLARACGSTALAFSMHTHQVAIPAWRWRHRQAAAVEPLLRRVAAERLVLLSSGGSDWIAGSGAARKVEGGWRVSARKVFTSAAPAGDILMTGAVVEEEDGARSVIHFGAPMKAAEVRIDEVWRALGMRGTGSQNVVLDELFIADAAVALKRPAGVWHPLFQIIATIAFPLIYSVYLGVAESARDIAVDLARKRGTGPQAIALAGRMETALRAAQIGHEAMLAAVERNDPSADSVNEVMMAKALATEKAIETVELAMELAGGAGFYRDAGLERRFRDIQAARYHPMHPGPQAEYAGAMALGLPVAAIY